MQIPNVSSDQPSARAVRCWDTSCQGRGRCWRRIGCQLFQSGTFQTFPLQSLNKMSAFQLKCRKHGSNKEAQEEDLDLVQKNTWSSYLQQTDQKIWSFAVAMYFLSCRKRRQLPKKEIDTFIAAQIDDSGVGQN